MILKIDNITFGYKGSQNLFSNFSLELKRGEIISIVGKSGSGKSTLFDLISKELKPKSGSIKAGKIAQVYQDPYTSFHGGYTIINQIEDVGKIENLDFWLEKISLGRNLLDKKPHQLSGGQLQRCSILRAVLMKTDLILADEPTSALDNLTQLEVMKLLISLLDNVGIVLVTHDRDLAKWCSDKIIDIEKL
ncbi:MAG: ATP-binding cassette domain-containing protein [Campylobacterales bacterium]|nr:ATP-binding cassette domain-containing protein [Campylobacterales bacterium]